MFDIGWTEVAVIVTLALIIIGPKDIPKTMGTIARWIGKAKAMAGEFQRNIDDMIKEAELDEVKNQLQTMRTFDIKSQIENAVDEGGEIRKSMDFSKEAADFNRSMKEDSGAASAADPIDPTGLPAGENKIEAPSATVSPTPLINDKDKA